MKKNSTFKKMLAVAALMVAGTQASMAQFNNVWLKADVYPADGGLVYVDYSSDTIKNVPVYATTSEFKRSEQLVPGAAFIYVRPATGYLFAGVARDSDKNGQFGADDKQIHIWANGYFDAIYDKTSYQGASSSTEGYAMAQEALAQMTSPTDQVFAVFTKGAAAHRAVGQEAFGKVYSSKLDNAVGDEVTFTAYGDSYSDSGVQYFKFSHWTNAAGETVSTEREFKVTVKGTELYYANFVETTQEEFKQTEDDPNKIDWNNQEPDDPWGWLGVKSIKTESQSNAVYNLQGRKVNTLVKGLYISNGKKVLVR